jgi:hypothetical protein
MVWLLDWLKDDEIKAKLGVPDFVNFTPISEEVNQNFVYNGDVYVSSCFRVRCPN